MKKFIISLLLLAVLTGLIIVHSVVMLKFGKEAGKMAETIKQSAQNDEWERVRADITSLTVGLKLQL